MPKANWLASNGKREPVAPCCVLIDGREEEGLLKPGELERMVNRLGGTWRKSVRLASSGEAVGPFLKEACMKCAAAEEATNA
jgi:hypothetical protein